MEQDQRFQSDSTQFEPNSQPEKMKILTKDLRQFEKVASQFDSNSLTFYINKLRQLIKEGNVQKIAIPIEYKIENPTKSPFCSATVGYTKQKSRVFKCLDCMYASNTIICRECFFASDHRGHNYRQIYSGQGCCDCGNDEMLNPKGFCPQHSPKITQLKIDQRVQTLFLAQTSFLFHVCFWLEQRSEQGCVDMYFAVEQMQALLDKLIQLVSLNFDYKYLCFKTMQQNCTILYPTLPALQYNNHSILQTFFKLPPKNYLKNFCRLAYEVFPVRQMKAIIIKQFFKKTNQDQTFSFPHPLRMLNFQFMTCIKTINLLIKQKQLQPLKLPPTVKITGLANDLYLKFVDDYHYPLSVKGMDQYIHLFFQRENVARTFFTYRQLPDTMVFKEAFDDYFLKIFRHFIKGVKSNKMTLKKIIDDLLAYLIERKDICSSLAHQRALALTIVAYLDTDILSLADPQKAREFNKSLGLDQSNIKAVLEPIIIRHLQILLNTIYEKPKKIPNDYVEQFFYSNNPEKQILLILDCCFQKIFALTSYNYVSYASSIVTKTIEKIKSEPGNQLKMYKLVSFLNFAFSIDVDIYSSASFIGLKHKNSIIFYNRIINTFKQMSSISIKTLALKVLLDQSLFQEFVKHQCFVQKGALRTVKQFQPLQYLGNSGFFKQFSITMKNLQQVKNKSTLLPEFQQFSIWSNQSIDILIGLYLQYIEDEQNLKKSTNIMIGLLSQSLAIQLAKVYVNTTNTNLETFLVQVVYPLALKQKWSSLVQILKRILPNSLILQNKQSEEEVMLLKKNRLVQKKKYQMQKMKKLHHQILKDHQYQQNPSQSDNCISCKEKGQEELKIISLIQIDDFFSNLIQKTNSFRISFRTCGHKIHPSCFFQKQINIDNKKCYLCNMQANCLLPEFKKTQNSDEIVQQFLNLIYPILMNQPQHLLESITSFYQSQCHQNILRAIINSIIVEILTLGIYQKTFIKFNIKPIFQQLLHLIKQLPWETVSIAFAIDESNQKQLPLNDEYMIIRNVLHDYFKLKGQFHAKYSQQNPTHLQKLVIMTLDYLNGDSAQLNQESLNEWIIANFDEYVFEIPRKLNELQLYMGKCPECSQITQRIYLCLLCGWRACLKNKQVVINHFHSHKNGAIFVNCHTGERLYLINQGLFARYSLYVNYLGQPYKTAAFTIDDSKNYSLNEPKYESVVRSIVTNQMVSTMLKQLFKNQS